MSAPDRLTSAVVRVRAASGWVSGAGFLVAEDLVCTCAHVVARALGIEDAAASPPVGSVRIDFPLLGADTATHARVHWWEPIRPDGGGDVALLRLAEVVPGARPVPLVAGGDVWDHEFRVIGFPEHRDEGVWAHGRLRAPQGAGLIQMDTGDGLRIEHGYSGSAVWDGRLGGVVGMTVAADGPTRPSTAYLVPSSALGEITPRLWPSPYRSLSAFSEADAALFYGRDADISTLLSTVESGRPVAVIGPSGSGKSSLVRAGLLPRLRAAGVSVTDFRPLPGTDAALTVAHAVLPHLEPDLSEIEKLERAPRLAALLRGNAALVAQRLATRGHLLFLDQLEEISATDLQTARELFELLVTMAEAVPGLRVVVTMRSESIDDLLTASIARTVRTVLVAPLDGDNLRAAITEPAKSVPGLDFDAGLVDRLVADAGEQPGRLPLVEFALTRLYEHWVNDAGDTLTHAAYDAAGGVAGALATYADEIYLHRLLPQEQPLLQRAFTQLARPDGRGGFIRRPARASEFDENAWSLLIRLASDTRLVVIGKSPDGEAIVDLAHEALIARWPRLHTWLDEAADFRAWQEQLRQHLAQWNATGQDQGGLLRGAPLAAALEWAAAHHDDLAASERDYIVRSSRAERRGIRRWRFLTAAAVVLALAAATLAAVATENGARVRDQLRAQASQLLAQDAQRRQDASPSTAALLALAAWRTDPTQPDAWGALFQLNADLATVDRAIPVGSSAAPRFIAAPDGRTAAFENEQGAVSILTGLPDDPRVYHLPDTQLPNRSWDVKNIALSPDGSEVAIVDQRRGLIVSSTAAPAMPVQLRQPPDSGEVIGDLAFTSDGKRVLALLEPDPQATGPDIGSRRIEAWDVNSRMPVALPITIASGPDVLGVDAGADPDIVLLEESDAYSARDLRTGAEVGLVPGRELGLGGSVAVDCPDDNLEVRDVPSGTLRSTTADCQVSGELDASGRYAVKSEGTTDSLAWIVVTDLRNGTSVRAAIPNSSLSDGAASDVLPLPDGKLAILQFRGGDLVRSVIPAPHPNDPAMDDISDDTHNQGGGSYDVLAASPDGRFQLRFRDQGAWLRDTTTGATSAVPAGLYDDLATVLHESPMADAIEFSADGSHLIVPMGGVLHVYAVPGMFLEHALTLTTAPEPRTELGDPTLAMTDDGGMFTNYAGLLSSWDLTTGQLRQAPLRLRDDPADQELEAQSPSEITARPRHRDQALLRGINGNVELADLQGRRLVEISRTGPVGFGLARAAFDRSGDHLAMVHGLDKDATIEVWNVAEVRQERAIVAPKATDVAGFTPEGYLVVRTGDGLQVWDQTRSRPIAELLSTEPGMSWSLRDNTLVAGSDSDSFSLPLDVNQWIDHLCRAVGRSLTENERELLPPGAENMTAPCG